MKFTRLHTNAIAISIVLMVLQVFLIWQVNGAIDQIILGGGANIDVLMVLFSPTAGLVWALKHFANIRSDCYGDPITGDKEKPPES